MNKYLATLILAGLTGIMLCGFFVMGSATHDMNHTGSNTFEQHFSMWSDVSNVLISNIVASIVTLILILLLPYFVIRNFKLYLLSIQIASDRIPIHPDRVLSKRTKLTRWLSLFENSPSYA